MFTESRCFSCCRACREFPRLMLGSVMIILDDILKRIGYFCRTVKWLAGRNFVNGESWRPGRAFNLSGSVTCSLTNTTLAGVASRLSYEVIFRSGSQGWSGVFPCVKGLQHWTLYALFFVFGHSANVSKTVYNMHKNFRAQFALFSHVKLAFLKWLLQPGAVSEPCSLQKPRPSESIPPCQLQGPHTGAPAQLRPAAAAAAGVLTLTSAELHITGCLGRIQWTVAKMLLLDQLGCTVWASVLSRLRSL